MGKSIDLLEGSRSTMEEERELLFCFGRAGVRKKRKRAIGEEREGYKYPPSPQRSLKSQIAIREERERYIYPQPSMDTAPKRSGETKTVTSRSGNTEPMA